MWAKKSMPAAGTCPGFIETAAPGLVLCGHIHEDFGIRTIDQSTVVNCAIAGKGFGAVIDLEKNQTPKVNLLQSDRPQD